MRRLVVTRGCPGTGKSTLLEAFGLDPFSISPDRIRLLLGGPAMTPDGRMSAPQEQSPRAWRMAHQMLEERMGRGELVCMDATHADPASLLDYEAPVRRFGYKALLLDFSTQPVERALAANAARPDLTRVPDAAIRRMHASARSGAIPDGWSIARWDGSKGMEDALRGFLDVPVRDLSSWRSVRVVGDVQGCFDALAGPSGLYPSGRLPSEDFHVFVGDYLDRGTQNGEVMRWILENAVDRPNVVLLEGNHEKHLRLWADGRPPVSSEFAKHTLPQLQAAGFGPGDAAKLVGSLEEAFAFSHGGRKVLAVHAGLSAVPDRLAEVPSDQLINGVGSYDAPVDEVFAKNAPPGWTQIHGHRNRAELPILASAKSFNLEGRVEQGGSLRAVDLDASGFRPIAVRNSVFRPLVDRLAEDPEREASFADLPLPPWAKDASDRSMPEEAMLALRSHPLIHERVSPSRAHLSSFNFTREAFSDGAWDDLNLRARGLFIDTETREILARAYDKFFNVEERPETRLGALRSSLVFPLSLWVKENGFLGILGHDARSDELLYCSKSSPDTQFAGWFKEIVEESVPEGRRDALRRWMRDTGTSLTFEVIDPVRDPHIIEQPVRKVVLLDAVRRHARFESMPYDALKRLGEKLGLEVKDRGPTFKDWASFEGWMKKACAPDLSHKHKGVHPEGYVLEDSVGFQTKLKLPYYVFWKRMRSLVERMDSIQGTGRPLGRDRDLVDPRAAAFHGWLSSQAPEALPALLKKDIVFLRGAYESDRRFKEGEVALPEGSAPARPPREDPAVAGYRAALANLAGSDPSARAGADLKPATAERLAQAACADVRKAALLAGSPLLPAVLSAIRDPKIKAAAEAAMAGMAVHPPAEKAPSRRRADGREDGIQPI